MAMTFLLAVVARMSIWLWPLIVANALTLMARLCFWYWKAVSGHTATTAAPQTNRPAG